MARKVGGIELDDLRRDAAYDDYEEEYYDDYEDPSWCEEGEQLDDDDDPALKAAIAASLRDQGRHHADPHEAVSLGDFMAPSKHQPGPAITGQHKAVAQGAGSSGPAVSAAALKERLAAAVSQFEEEQRQARFAWVPIPKRPVIEEAAPEDSSQDPTPPAIYGVPYDCWSVIFSFSSDPRDALHTADSDDLLRLIIEQSGIFEHVWKALETTVADVDQLCRSSLIARGPFTLPESEQVENLQQFSRLRFPWSKKLSLQYREMKDAVLSHFNSTLGHDWVKRNTAADDEEESSSTTTTTTHTIVVRPSGFNSYGWLDDFFDEDLMNSITEAMTEEAHHDRQQESQKQKDKTKRREGDNELSESDLEAEMSRCHRNHRLYHALNKRHEFEVRAWLELYETTTHPMARKFAQIQANRYAGMYNIALELAEGFDFTKLHKSIAALIRAPTTPRKVQVFLSNLRVRSFDHYMENEHDICTAGAVFEKVKARDYAVLSAGLHQHAQSKLRSGENETKGVVLQSFLSTTSSTLASRRQERRNRLLNYDLNNVTNTNRKTREEAKLAEEEFQKEQQEQRARERKDKAEKEAQFKKAMEAIEHSDAAAQQTGYDKRLAAVPKRIMGSNAASDDHAADALAKVFNTKAPPRTYQPR